MTDAVAAPWADMLPKTETGAVRSHSVDLHRGGQGRGGHVQAICLVLPADVFRRSLWWSALPLPSFWSSRSCTTNRPLAMPYRRSPQANVRVGGGAAGGLRCPCLETLLGLWYAVLYHSFPKRAGSPFKTARAPPPAAAAAQHSQLSSATPFRSPPLKDEQR